MNDLVCHGEGLRSPVQSDCLFNVSLRLKADFPDANSIGMGNEMFLFASLFHLSVPHQTFLIFASAPVTDDDFLMFFQQFGVVVDSVVMFDKETRRSHGFGFVTFEEPVSMQKDV